MANVKFLKGLSTNLPAERDSQTFYLTTDTHDLYLGATKLSNGADIEAALEQIKGLDLEIGNLDNLTTNKKDDLVNAINEVSANINTKAVTLTSSTSNPDFATVYTLKQGETAIGNINIPKDLVVESGSLVTNPEGQEPGTYIELIISNSAEDKIYIPVTDLVDIYTAEAGATEVQLTVSPDGVISAVLVDNAVTTTKIKDGNVTKAKLEQTVQESLNKADAAAAQTDLDSLSVKVTALETAIGEGGSVEEQINASIDEALTWSSF